MNTNLDIEKKKNFKLMVLNQPLVFIALFYGFGAVLSRHIVMETSTALYIFGGFILAFIITLVFKHPVKIILYAAMFFIGFVITLNAIPDWYNKEQPLPSFERFDGVSTGDGYIGDGYVVVTLSEVVGRNDKGKSNLDGDVRLIIFGYNGEYESYFEDFGKGSKVSVDTNLKLIPVKQYEGAFDLPFYRMMDNINYEASSHYAQIGYVTGEIKPITKLNIFRSELRQSILDDFDISTAGIIIALLMGDKHFLTEELYNNFSLLGIAHFLAVSGMHIGILVGVILWLFRKLQLGILPSIFISFIVILAYGLLVGASPSVLRAIFMWIVFCTILFIGEKPSTLISISIVFLGLLLINPLDIFSISFQLSFTATGGIVLLSDYIQQITKKIKPKPIKWIAAGMLVSASAILSIWTILINSFGYIAPATIITTMIGVLPLTVMLLLSVIYGGIFSIGISIPKFLITIIGKVGEIITNGMNFMSQYAVLIYIKPVSIVVVILSIILLLILSRKIFRTKIWIHILSAGVLAVVIIILSFAFKGEDSISLDAVALSYYDDTSILLFDDGESLAAITKGGGREIELFCDDNHIKYPKTIIFMCDEPKEIIDLLEGDLGSNADIIYVPLALKYDMEPYISLFDFKGELIGVNTATILNRSLRFKYIQYSAVSKDSKTRYCVETLGNIRLQYIDPRYYRAKKGEFRISDIVVVSRFTKSRLQNISNSKPKNLIYNCGMSFGSEYDALLDKSIHSTYNTNRVGAIGIKDNSLLSLGERETTR